MLRLQINPEGGHDTTINYIKLGLLILKGKLDKLNLNYVWATI